MTLFFFFNDTATTEIYTLSLHDALPIYEVLVAPREHGGVQAQPVQAPAQAQLEGLALFGPQVGIRDVAIDMGLGNARSEEHTSELQSHLNLVCRLLLEKKKK